MNKSGKQRSRRYRLKYFRRNKRTISKLNKEWFEACNKNLSPLQFGVLRVQIGNHVEQIPVVMP